MARTGRLLTVGMRHPVVTVLVLVVIGVGSFYGWMKYSGAQYEARRAAVIRVYAAEYRTCRTAGHSYVECSKQVYDDCQADRFWYADPPFSFGLGDPLSDASTLCQAPAHL